MAASETEGVCSTIRPALFLSPMPGRAHSQHRNHQGLKVHDVKHRQYSVAAYGVAASVTLFGLSRIQGAFFAYSVCGSLPSVRMCAAGRRQHCTC
jgi:hypothetical protein